MNFKKQKKKIFRYKEDRLPVVLILILSALDFVAYFTIDNLYLLFGYYLFMIIPKGAICAWNHHHQHLSTFHNNILNRGLEFFYALHTGVTTNLWRLHHVLGHHINFLDQRNDESRWMTKQGKKMGVLYYTFEVAITAYPRGFGVGKKYPKLQKPFIFYSILTFLVLLALAWYRPLPAIFLFVLPMITSLFYTTWVTYGHHAGLSTEDEFSASYNNLNPLFNRITGNLGYHTAHHHKMGIHWSRLPELHEKISTKIPNFCYQKSKFTKWFLRDMG